MKMRDYVDGIRGAGSWDRMHDAIGRKELVGWSLPHIPLDGGTARIFPGSDREVTLEQVQAECRKAITQVERGDYELVNGFDD